MLNNFSNSIIDLERALYDLINAKLKTLTGQQRRVSEEQATGASCEKLKLYQSSKKEVITMKKVIFPVARVLMGVLFVLTITVGVAPAFDPGPNEVILYEHIDYGGRSIRFSVGSNVPNLTNNKSGTWNWNDKVSSIKVGANVRLITWQDKDYTGKCMGFLGSNAGGKTGKYRHLGDWHYNDAITSLKVYGPDDPEARCP